MKCGHVFSITLTLSTFSLSLSPVLLPPLPLPLPLPLLLPLPSSPEMARSERREPEPPLGRSAECGGSGGKPAA